MEQQESISLSSLAIPTKTLDVDYPGLEGFTLSLTFLAREENIKIRRKATKTVWRNRLQAEELDEELFLKLYVGAVIKGWKGLKYKYLPSLMLVDISKVKDVDAELPFNLDNAVLLMKNSSDFDSFITEMMSDLGLFTKSSQQN